MEVALECFRKDGVGNTGMREIASAAGVTTGSLYNDFGGKDALFRSAFARYRREVVLGRIAEHAPPDAGLDGLEALMLSLLEDPCDEFGCLLTNSLIELGVDGPARFTDLASAVDDLRGAFCDVLARVAGIGDPEVEAERLLIFYQGMLVMVRSGLGGDLAQAIRSEIAALGGRT